MQCSAPPHPSLFTKIKREYKLAKESHDDDRIKTTSRILHGGKGILGMNDGTIFPRSHFSEQTSIMSMSRSAFDRAPLRGPIRVIVVLVDFLDVKMTIGAKERVEELWFSANNVVPTGSVNDYYGEVSNGLISITGEVVGPFTLSRRLSQYANNHSGRGWRKPNSQTMADEAWEAVQGLVTWQPYDNDGNGYVDAFVVVHAGRAAEETGEAKDLWSLKWTLPKPRVADNVKVYSFMTVAEDTQVGVCAHELGHLLFGWPDLHEADHTSANVGNWCLMSYGCWGGGGSRPVHPSAWCKVGQGWIEVVTESENRMVTLQDVKSGRKCHRLWTDGDTGSPEYFLVENRQLIGFDEYLPAGGLLIWHIDDGVWSNIDEAHPKVKLMQADGLGQLKGNWGRGDSGDVYPGFENVSNFGAATNPNSQAYSGTDTFVSITNIPASSPTMAFDITIRQTEQHEGSGFDPKTWYRLSNAGHKPATHCLDVINDNGKNSKGAIEMRPNGNYSGQYWQLKSNGDGTHFLRTMFLGADRRLDVCAHNIINPLLQAYAPTAGQYWLIKPWGDGTWHLENVYSGQYRYLDVADNSIAVKMGPSNSGRPTQRWTITQVRDISESDFD